MPAPELCNLTDYAVLWETSTSDGYGRSKVSAAVEIRVRWEDSRSESGDPQNTVQSNPVTVFVDRAIAMDSILWHGKLVDVPTVPTGLCKVVGVGYTPDIKGRVTQRTVTLMRHGDVLPEIV